MSDVMFRTNGKGRWWKSEFPTQCEHDCFMYGRCQAVKGHKGYHWNYSKNGDYQWDHNDDDPQEDHEIAACGSIPPGARGYIWPGRSKNYYMNFTKHGEVTDSVELARLERGEFEENESVDRPLMPTDEHYEEIMRRSKESDEIEARIRKNRSFWKKVKYFFIGEP